MANLVSCFYAQQLLADYTKYKYTSEMLTQFQALQKYLNNF